VSLDGSYPGSDMSNKAKPVRILPMSKKEFSGQTYKEVQLQFFLSDLPTRPGCYYKFRKNGLNAETGTIVLFQYDNRLIASATLNRREIFDTPDGEHHGALYFEANSIRIFDPVDSKTVKTIWPDEFKKFNQSMARLSAEPFPQFERQLTGVKTFIEFENIPNQLFHTLEDAPLNTVDKIQPPQDQKNNVDIKYGKSGRLAKLVTLAKPLKPEHIYSAIEKFNNAEGVINSYSQSTEYDLVVNNKRYPPKTILGLALSHILKFDVLSSHFSGDEGSPCFRILENLGFSIAIKPRPSRDDGLIVYNKYSRKDVSQIFDPNYKFVQNSGRWGISGIVSNYPRKDDFVFFVTLDPNTGNDYDDYLTEDGALAWKSQKQHTANSSKIKKLVNHDEDKNTIYLFMRRNDQEAYTFFGPLSFRDWTPNSSMPVNFLWDFVSWPLPAEIGKEFCSFIRPAIMPGYNQEVFIEQELVVVPPPKPTNSKNTKPKNKKSNNVDWEQKGKRNRELGLKGEKLVLKYERQVLTNAGYPDLANKVEHVAISESSAGYDIKAYNTDGSEKYIEVKTTTGSKNTPFYISTNEVSKSKELASDFWIYRVFNFKPESSKIEFYSQKGNVEDTFQLIPESFKATFK
jgi:hypothetical protein